MTPPPPSEPIRPVGPIAGGVYVDRTAMSDLVKRRRRRRDPDQRERDANDHPDEQHDESHPGRPVTQIRDPRAYDDHGRRPDDEDDDVAGPHIDATA